MNVLPSEYKERMAELLGGEAEEFFASYEKNARKSLRINTLKNRNQKGALTSELPFSLTPIKWCDTGFYYEDEDTPGKHPLHEAGAYYIQEASAMKPVTLLDARPGMHVLDLCAAPGGKTSQIAALMEGEGILVTNEPVPGRASILSENVERMGIVNAVVTSELPQKLAGRFEGFFDRILVDAPCSGEGMFRKNPEAISEWSLENVDKCIERQREILEAAISMLAPGGRLVYSTCTFEKGEDEDNAKWVETTFKDMTLVSEERIWPHKEEGEGHFLSVFEKKGEGVTSNPRGGYEKTDSKKLNQVLTYYKDLLEGILSKDSKLKERLLSKESSLKLFGENIYLLPKDCPNLEGLKVLRTGLMVGNIKKDRMEPAHSLALAMNALDAARAVEVSTEAAASYIEGLSIPCDPSLKGWVLVCTKGYSLGFGKASGGMIKNHYPKGLRKRL